MCFLNVGTICLIHTHSKEISTTLINHETCIHLKKLATMETISHLGRALRSRNIFIIIIKWCIIPPEMDTRVISYVKKIICMTAEVILKMASCR